MFLLQVCVLGYCLLPLALSLVISLFTIQRTISPSILIFSSLYWSSFAFQLWSLIWFYEQVLCRIILIHSPTTFLVVLRCLVTLAGGRPFIWFSHFWSFWSMPLRLKVFLKTGQLFLPTGFCWSTFASMQFLGDCTAPARWLVFRIGPTLIGLLTLTKFVCVWRLNIRHFVLSTNLF